jgi:hypothetical protein
VRRGQIAKINSNAAGYTETIPSGRQTFSDISSSHHFYAFVERLQMHGALEEIPLDAPNRPNCSTAGTMPCWHPDHPATRSDAAQLIYLARNTSLLWGEPGGPAGQAFPRRLTEVNEVGGHDGVQAFVRTPNTNPVGNGILGGPLGLADATNGHFIESGPDRRCTYASDSAIGDGTDAIDACLNYPYASSSTVTMCWYPAYNIWAFCDDPRIVNTNFYLATNSSYEFRSFYAGGTNGEWWAEFYNDTLNVWTRLITVYTMGTPSMREVFGAAETSSYAFTSGTIRITNARSHQPGGSWTGWCYDAGITPLKMFNSSFSPCPPPGVEPFSWDARYNPPPTPSP